jgi:hypothetical protein
MLAGVIAGKLLGAPCAASIVERPACLSVNAGGVGRAHKGR